MSIKLQIKNGNFERQFESIANELFNKWVIVNKYSSFRLTDIEFYWHSKTHEDKSVYERNHVKPKQGQWFFHYSGVDIALDNDDGYGGILIRGIRDINVNDKKGNFNGPLVCAMKLFTGMNAFEENTVPILKNHQFENKELKKLERVNLGENSKEGGFNKKKYRFKITI
jgi:hypothetical protein